MKGDSWFGSVKAAATLADRGIECVLQVKANSGLYPKEFIDNALDGAPGDTHIVMKDIHPNGATLIALGYRYL